MDRAARVPDRRLVLHSAARPLAWPEGEGGGRGSGRRVPAGGCGGGGGGATTDQEEWSLSAGAGPAGAQCRGRHQGRLPAGRRVGGAARDGGGEREDDDVGSRQTAPGGHT